MQDVHKHPVIFYYTYQCVVSNYVLLLEHSYQGHLYNLHAIDDDEKRRYRCFNYKKIQMLRLGTLFLMETLLLLRNTYFLVFRHQQLLMLTESMQT